MWLASDSVRIGYTARNLVGNFCLDGEVHKIINHKNMSDKRRWRVLRGHNIPHGIKSVNEAKIMKEIPKMKRKSAKMNYGRNKIAALGCDFFERIRIRIG